MHSRTRSHLTAFLAAVAMLAAAQHAGAQTPRPYVPNEVERSGILTRHVPITPLLPHDPDRDDFYLTRRADAPPHKPNCMLTSGLYGLPLKCDCTVSFRPYFWGSPGGESGPNCEKVNHRLFGNFFHPWRPVYYYYSGGSYTPVYDLDPICPGPGPFPFSRLYHKQKQGG